MTALLVSLVLAILLGALLSTRVVEIRAVTGTVESTRAQLIAEAGVDHVLALIASDVIAANDGEVSLGTYSASDQSFADGEYDAFSEVDTTTGLLRVESTGMTAGKTARTVEALVSLSKGNSVTDQFGVFTCNDLVVGGNAEVKNTDIYSGGNLSIQTQGDAVVNGDAIAKGNISFDSGNASITGNVISTNGTIGVGTESRNKVRAGGYASNPDPVPGSTTLFVGETGLKDVTNDAYLDIDDYCGPEGGPNPAKISDDAFAVDPSGSYYAAASLEDPPGPVDGPISVTSGGAGDYNGQHIILGDMSISGTPESEEPYFDGIYFVDGDLTISGNYEGNATFVVTGNLSVTGGSVSGASATQDSDQAYIVNGDVDIAGGSVFNGSIYANGNLTQSGNGNAVVNGSIIAIGDNSESGTSTLRGGLTVNYQRNNSEVELPYDRIDNIDVQRWRLLTN